MPPRKKSAETPVQKKAREAREAYKTASENAEKPGATAATKSAMEHAQKAMTAANAEENRERFLKYGEGRANKVVNTINSLGDVFNPKSFAFNQKDADTILAGIDTAVEGLKSRITAALAGGTAKAVQAIKLS